MYGPYVCYFYL